MNTIRKFLSILATVFAFSSAYAGNDSFQIAIADDVTLDRASIAALDGDRSVWVQRNYREQISLGNDTATGAPIYPHQSVQIQYVVDCSSQKLNLVSWKMFSDANSRGKLVWESGIQGTDAAYRYAPGTEEEKAVVVNLCGSSVAALH